LKNCWHWRLGIEPTSLDIYYQSGAYDLTSFLPLKKVITSLIKSPDLLSARKMTEFHPILELNKRIGEMWNYIAKID